MFRIELRQIDVFSHACSRGRISPSGLRTGVFIQLIRSSMIDFPLASLTPRIDGAVRPAAAPSAKRGRKCSVILTDRMCEKRVTERTKSTTANAPASAQRSNPESLRGSSLDCFASLAMTM
ncbi:hypothetical protein MTR72_30795 [Bradyrhizobium sp. ISRA442]|uniref:hypothetical protein n=1 Tax=Bradyrhizobium sp. ISRA442 TaxID=2866197 RepID=UPI00311B32CD